jgi:hypothetical protein
MLWHRVTTSGKLVAGKRGYGEGCIMHVNNNTYVGCMHVSKIVGWRSKISFSFGGDNYDKMETLRWITKGLDWKDTNHITSVRLIYSMICSGDSRLFANSSRIYQWLTILPRLPLLFFSPYWRTNNDRGWLGFVSCRIFSIFLLICTVFYDFPFWTRTKLSYVWLRYYNHFLMYERAAPPWVINYLN